MTGKPSGVDLSEHKATSVVVSAYHLADPSLRRELAALMCAADLGEADIHRWRRLIAQTGAVESIEQMIIGTDNAVFDHVRGLPPEAVVAINDAGAIAYLVRHLKAHTGLKVEMHCHNDLNLAVANSISGAAAVIEAGQRSRSSKTHGNRRTRVRPQPAMAQKNCGEVETTTSGRFSKRPATNPVAMKLM